MRENMSSCSRAALIAWAVGFATFRASIASADSADWFSCSRPSDCIKVPGPCVSRHAVNKAFKREYAAVVDKIDQTAQCLVPTKEALTGDENSIVACEKQKCVLKYKE